MSLIESISQLNAQSIEAIEKLTLRWVFQAIVDFGFEAYTVFQQSPDDVKDIAEDITREVLDCKHFIIPTHKIHLGWQGATHLRWAKSFACALVLHA